MLSPEILLDLENANGVDWSVALIEHRKGSPGGIGAVLGIGQQVPSGITPVAYPLMSPNPLLETEQEFFVRAKEAWVAALKQLSQESGLELKIPRKLKLHCEWLVQRVVCGQTAVQILGELDHTDPSTVYKATASLGALLGLSVDDNLN